MRSIRRSLNWLLVSVALFGAGCKKNHSPGTYVNASVNGTEMNFMSQVTPIWIDQYTSFTVSATDSVHHGFIGISVSAYDASGSVNITPGLYTELSTTKAGFVGFVDISSNKSYTNYADPVNFITVTVDEVNPGYIKGSFRGKLQYLPLSGAAETISINGEFGIEIK